MQPAPQSHEIEAVVFDIGKVLIDYDFDRVVQHAARLSNVPSLDIRHRIVSTDMLHDFECGRISEREFHDRIQALLKQTFPFEDFCMLWNSIFTEEIESTVEIFHDLRKRPGLKTGILSNTNILHFTYLQKRMGLLSDMTHVYASHEIRCRKPDAESFQHILKDMGVTASRTVFIDDLPENISAAKELGIHCILAVNDTAVRSGLVKLGLI